MDEQDERAATRPGTAARHRQARRRGLRRVLTDIEAFGATVLGAPLRPYQARVARAALASVAAGSGHTLTVLMPRQSGKNELSATSPCLPPGAPGFSRAG